MGIEGPILNCGSCLRYQIRYRGHTLLLMHAPWRPEGHDGWIIHGDKHNNDPVNYPHINAKSRTVNVCAEFTDYSPMSLDSIMAGISGS